MQFPKLKLKIKKIDLIFISFASILLIPRFIAFFTKSDYFNGDFAFYYFLTKDIMLEHKLPLLGHVVGEIGGFAQGPLWSYLLTIPFFIFNGDPFGGKVFMLLTSVLIYLSGSLFFYKFFGKAQGYLAAFLLGSSPYLIKWTNLAWPPYTVPLLTVFYLIFLYLFLLKKKNKYLYISSLSLGLFAHFEVASLGLLLPSFLILLAFLYYKKLVNVKVILKSFLAISISFIPHFVYDLTHNFYNIRGLIGIITNSSSSERNPLLLIIADRLHLLKTDLSAVFPVFDYRILIIILGFLLVGFYLYIKDKKIKKRNKIFAGYLLLIIPTTFLSINLIPVERASFWWITYLSVTYIFFTIIILGFLYRKSFFGQIFVIIIIIISLTSFRDNLKELLSKYEEHKNQTHEVMIQAPIEYIYADSKNQPFSVIFITSEKKIIDYKYMLWFLKHNKFINSSFPNNMDLNYSSPGGVPAFINEPKQFNNLKKGSYYIIISNKTLESGYAKRILEKNNFGNIIYTREIEKGINGFTVQKRIIN